MSRSCTASADKRCAASVLAFVWQRNSPMTQNSTRKKAYELHCLSTLARLFGLRVGSLQQSGLLQPRWPQLLQRSMGLIARGRAGNRSCPRLISFSGVRRLQAAGCFPSPLPPPLCPWSLFQLHAPGVDMALAVWVCTSCCLL